MAKQLEWTGVMLTVPGTYVGEAACSSSEDGNAHNLQPTKEKVKNDKKSPISELLSGKWWL